MLPLHHRAEKRENTYGTYHESPRKTPDERAETTTNDMSREKGRPVWAETLKLSTRARLILLVLLLVLDESHLAAGLI